MLDRARSAEDCQHLNDGRMRWNSEFGSVQWAVATGKPNSCVEHQRPLDNPVARQRLCHLIGASMWHDNGARLRQWPGLLQDRIPSAYSTARATAKHSYYSQAERNSR